MKINKQTAVEWLEQSLKLSDNVSEFDKWAFDKAKAMEKEQIIVAYKRERCYMKHAGCTDEQINKSAEQYYNKKFKSE